MYSTKTPLRHIPRTLQQIPKRSYANPTPGSPVWEVFNSKTKHIQKDRAGRNTDTGRKVDYLKDEVAMRLCERLLVCLGPPSMNTQTDRQTGVLSSHTGYKTGFPQRARSRRKQLQHSPSLNDTESRPRLGDITCSVFANLRSHLCRYLAGAPPPRHRPPFQQRHLHPQTGHPGSRGPSLPTEHLRRGPFLAQHPLDK